MEIWPFVTSMHKVYRAGSTGKRTQLMVQGRFKMTVSNCTLACWTRSICIQRYSVYEMKLAIRRWMISLHAADSLVTNVIKIKSQKCWVGLMTLNQIIQFWVILETIVTKRVYSQNLVIKRSDITKPCYNKVILLVPALCVCFLSLTLI